MVAAGSISGYSYYNVRCIATRALGWRSHPAQKHIAIVSLVLVSLWLRKEQ